MRVLGVVLWWDDRDGNGVIRDIDNSKYYFDSSVLPAQLRKKVKAGVIVSFEQNQRIKDCLCAHKVELAKTKQKSEVARKLASRRQLELF